MQRALDGEDERDQQDGAELADRSCRQQEGAERRAQLTAVGQDRDQRSDRRRRQRRSRVQGGHNHPGQRQHTGQGIGDRQRQHPAGQPQPQRPTADPPGVDLIAGEEEQQRQAKIGEEGDEIVDVPAEHVRADHHAQEQFDDHDRDDDPAPAGRRR